MADDEVGVSEAEAEPAGEAIHLPGPSYLPVITAFGVSLVVVGHQCLQCDLVIANHSRLGAAADRDSVRISGLLVRAVGVETLNLSVGVGIAVFVVSVLLHGRHQKARWQQIEGRLPPRFPSEGTP